MRPFIRRNSGRVSLYLAIAIVAAALETGIAFLLAELANSVTGASSRSPVTLMLFGLVYLIPLGLFDWLRAVTVTRLQTRFTACLRNEIIESALASSLPRDRSIVESGEGLQAAMVNDSEMIGEDYAYSFFSMLHQQILLIGGLIGTAIINPVFIPIVLGLSVLGMLLPKFAKNSLNAVQQRVAAAKNKYMDRVTLVSSGLESLLSIRRTGRVRHVVDEAINEVERAENSRFATRNFVWTLTWVFGLVIIIGVWGIGAKLATLGWISIGGIVALAQLMTQVAGPLQSMAEQYSQFIAGREQYRELKEKLTPVSPPPSSPASTARKVTGALATSVDALTLQDFSVSADEHVLTANISGSFPRGARVLVSGPSGAGKTSFLRGLAGLQTTSGTISINGITIHPQTPRENQIRLITQNPIVIPGTLADNIDPDMSGTNNALDLPYARVVLGPLTQTVKDQPELPIAKLSGGETRRVHVATGLAQPGAVLLLDEITTGLDTQSADKVLRAALGSATDYVFAVAHDLPASISDLGFTHILEIRGGLAVGIRETGHTVK